MQAVGGIHSNREAEYARQEPLPRRPLTWPTLSSPLGRPAPMDRRRGQQAAAEITPTCMVSLCAARLQCCECYRQIC